MIKWLTELIMRCPVYPHWLEFQKANIGTKRVLKGIKGAVLEVGAGDGARKKELMARYSSITDYISTDYSSWDGEFEKIDNRISKWSIVENIFFGHKKREQLDTVCSATALPFPDNHFDYHISFEVLEHIDDPYQYFREANRVLKPGGMAIVVMPFLYRMHGGEAENHRLDFFRYTNGFFYNLSQRCHLEVVEIYHNTGYGTTLASLTNQYVIRTILESNIFFRILFLFLAPFIFLCMNLIGYVIDTAPDKRFATRFHVVLKKKTK